MRTVRSATTK